MSTAEQAKSDGVPPLPQPIKPLTPKGSVSEGEEKPNLVADLSSEFDIVADMKKLSISNGNNNVTDEFEIGDANSPVCLVYDKRMMLHVAPIDHPEQPQRIERIWSAFVEDGIVKSCHRIPSRVASDEELLRCHPQKHINRIADCFFNVDANELEMKKQLLEQKKFQYRLDEDTYDGVHSNLAARLAAGSIIAVTEAVLSNDNKIKAGFAVIRPPGHHCESDVSQGFCLFNSVAVAARHAQQFAPKKCKKVLIVDWDVHHGNGTQNIFYDDPSVFYVSIHRSDGGKFYPGTGFAKELGNKKKKSLGANLNIPWPCRGLGDKEYAVAFEKILMPLCTSFKPDLLYISAGFDAALGDPLGGMKVSPAGYAYMTTELMKLANGNVIIALEGGYNLTSISVSAVACARALLGKSVEGQKDLYKFAKESTNMEQANALDSRALRSLNQMLQIQKDFWQETHDDDDDNATNPFNQQLKSNMTRTRKQTQKMKEAKSLQELFLERKNKKKPQKKRAGGRAKKQ
eukprot:g5481.t1